MSWKARVPLLAAALWWGSLSVVGFLVVPLLFANLATPAQAGQMAARLFSAQTWLSLACGMLVLVSARDAEGQPSLDGAGGALLYVIAGVLLALLAEFAVAPRIMARENLPRWHAIGSAMYLGQWVCALVVFWRTAFSRPGPS
ncbi:DUF4149 domain-containing protein [Caenimonas sedimenti]|uniref:DUF4149 domain-containing protein n=1 Tax=Caenimonas sedimenti TaxID=2596921 RepID=A0A562ZTF0_9BURK|nr:DUF4149 domain-containing protein [Caenimonas sedimenti]TWO71636.1 DUF4149 domain-containing protein [Caenimonas sedimenti]